MDELKYNKLHLVFESIYAIKTVVCTHINVLLLFYRRSLCVYERNKSVRIISRLTINNALYYTSPVTVRI